MFFKFLTKILNKITDNTYSMEIKTILRTFTLVYTLTIYFELTIGFY